jgi:hypothetical protein
MRAIRFPLEAPVTFWWNDIFGTRREGQGRSRDISESGAFILTKTCPPVGTRLGLKILLEEAAETTRAIRVEIDGHILRIDEISTTREIQGFAVFSDEAILKEEIGSA